jgi:glycosyltransferase involved in cell wall biosynthesis
MSTTARTYWIDLTDLSIWKGHPTGIQRVVYNIARYYAEMPNAKFFVYNESMHAFNEVAFQSIQLPKYQEKPQLTARQRLKRKIVYEAVNQYSLLPWEWRQKINPVLKPILVEANHKIHHFAHVVKQSIKHPVPKFRPKPARFKRDDVVLILGAGWARPSILDTLWRRKQTEGFKVFHFVHDIIPVYFPHLFGPGHFELSVNYFFDVAATCDGLLANSESTKRDMLRFCQDLNLPQLPIDVVRLGDEIPDRPEGAPPKGVELEPGNFILLHGTIEIRKNHALMYYVYKLAVEKGIKLPKLVITGRQGWNSHDIVFAMTHDPQVRDNIALVGSPHDVELSWLFQNCLFSVSPATYEGWNLPVAESLVLGKLCLTTPASSMPEIAGDLIEYFSPFDSGECLELMQKYLDPATLKQAEARIHRDYKVQTWRACFQEIHTAIEAQLHESKSAA